MPCKQSYALLSTEMRFAGFRFLNYASYADIIVILHLLVSVCTQFRIPNCQTNLSSHILFHCLSLFHSVGLFRCHNLGFPAVCCFTMTGCRPVAQPPTWKASPRYLQPPGQGSPAIPPSTGYPFRSPFTTCMACCGIIPFSSHLTGLVNKYWTN